MPRCRGYPALLALVVLVAGQLAALAHAAATRHVVCAQHGEQLDAATLVEQLHACEQDHVVGVEGNHAGSHEDCAIARSLHQSAQASHAPRALAIVRHVSDHHASGELAVPIATSLYLLAPKTSPPADALTFTT
jgi:hypothetical protein